MKLSLPCPRPRQGPVGALLLSALVLLAGCAGGLFPKPPSAPQRFTLDDAALMVVPPPAASTSVLGTPTLLIAPPRAAAGYDSTRMLYLRQSRQLEAFAFHEWVDTPAQMLAPLLLRSLQASGAFRAVLVGPTAASSNWRLETELVRLQQDFTRQPSRVRLSLRAVLVDSAARQVIAWRDFDESVVAASEDATGGAAAAQQAAQRVLAALAAFCAGQVPYAVLH